MKRALLIGIMLAFALLAMPFVSAAFPCAFVNNTQTIQSDDFNRADSSSCGSTMKGTAYINNVASKIENNLQYAFTSGAPCELPTITVTGGNISYQFNITLNGSVADLREINFDAANIGQLWFYRNGNSGICWANAVPAVQCSTNLVALNDKYTIRVNIDKTNSKWSGYWYNTSANTLVETFGETWETFTIGGFGGHHSAANKNWLLDDYMMWNSTALGGDACPTAGGAGETNPPIISNINCTSCVTDPTPNATPYVTYDTTPTFNFTTDKDAWCAISATDINYTAMGATRNCTTGEGSNGHICTLTSQDRFNNTGTGYVYISCKDSAGNEGSASNSSKSNSGALWMEITGPSEPIGDEAIQKGIRTSEIWPLNPTVYNDHQVYARNLSNAQFTGTFDRVAVLGTKRWALNYVSDEEIAITGPLFNLTPTLYVLQLQNQTNESITNKVSAFINGTYP